MGSETTVNAHSCCLIFFLIAIILIFIFQLIAISGAFNNLFWDLTSTGETLLVIIVTEIAFGDMD